jgi:hypothetical protein
MTLNEVESILPSIHLYPFPNILTWDISNQMVSAKASAAFKRTATLECPKCLCIDDLYSMADGFKFQCIWCAGGLEPTHESTHPLTGKTSIHTCSCSVFTCAHFHIHCNVCQYKFFLSESRDTCG